MPGHCVLRVIAAAGVAAGLVLCAPGLAVAQSTSCSSCTASDRVSTGDTKPGDGNTKPGDGGTKPGDGGTKPGEGGEGPGGGEEPGAGGGTPAPKPKPKPPKAPRIEIPAPQPRPEIVVPQPRNDTAQSANDTAPGSIAVPGPPAAVPPAIEQFSPVDPFAENPVAAPFAPAEQEGPASPGTDVALPALPPPIPAAPPGGPPAGGAASPGAGDGSGTGVSGTTEAAGTGKEQPDVSPAVAMDTLGPAQTAAVLGGVVGLLLAAVLAGVVTYQGAAAQQHRIAAARAEFFGTGA
ncbi:hypothetical protein OG921_09135 [Aldersonia sp. NBC_00410]|uniref:hypothetical protein n=1 Tax=Aldersonia sp. NBC_00410 TaxID=2975954 RepID=UPI0022527F62|nr:hypothetical protein [Aldersonia sp. NBC_00410]MCX5043333.1 hypothetical protein [Aldersonia sp. NBC_00410]